MVRFFQILLIGPIFYLKQRWKIGIALMLAIGVLTVITQIGGVILWLSLPIIDKFFNYQGLLGWLGKLTLFMVFYGFGILVIIPQIASFAGRVPLPCYSTIDMPLQPVNIGYCLLARNYVDPKLRTILEKTAQKMAINFPKSQIMYLDGNFPFINGFPLLPHLSHSDGKKLDIAYFYRKTSTHEPLDKPASPIGYWQYESPKNGEEQPCQKANSWLRWDFTWLQPMFSDVELDQERTKSLLQELISVAEIQKILIEPHLKARLDITEAKVRFQGCRAARHDDHVHIQIQ